MVHSQTPGTTLSLTDKAAVGIRKSPYEKWFRLQSEGNHPDRLEFLRSFAGGVTLRNPRCATCHSRKRDSAEKKLSNLHPSLPASPGE